MVREHWLNEFLRCFGDKGDVEDITEGPYHGLIASAFVDS